MLLLSLEGSKAALIGYVREHKGTTGERGESKKELRTEEPVLAPWHSVLVVQCCFRYASAKAAA